MNRTISRFSQLATPIFVGFLGLAVAPLASATPDAAKLLEKAEKIRNPQTDYTVQVTLKEKNKKDVRTFESMIKGRDKALVKFKKPSIEEGKKVLMVENSMWIYMPTTAKPIRISPRQKLAGNAAYGDIARLNFVGNYQATYSKETKVKGKKVHVLDLKAIDGQPVTYQRIEYWIDASTNRPLRVHYKTNSGKTLKVGYLLGYKKVFGVLRPTVLRIVDKVNKKNVTTLEFKNARKRSLPDIMFEKQNLSRS